MHMHDTFRKLCPTRTTGKSFTREMRTFFGRGEDRRNVVAPRQDNSVSAIYPRELLAIIALPASLPGLSSLWGASATTGRDR